MKTKALIITLLLICMVFPLHANLPVIDTTSIATSMAEFEKTIAQYAKEIEYWKQQTERAVRAAEGLASGDFVKVVESLASLTGLLSNLQVDLGVSKDLLTGIRDDSLNLLDLYKTADGYDITGFTQAVQKKLDSIKSIAEKGTGDWAYGGQSWDDLLNTSNNIFDIASLVGNYASGIVDISTSGLEFVNEMTTIMSAREKLDALNRNIELLELKYGDRDAVSREMVSVQSQIDSLREEKAGLTNEDATKLIEIEARENELLEKYEQLNKVRDIYDEANELRGELYKEWKIQAIEGLSKQKSLENASIDEALTDLYYQDAVKAAQELNSILGL